jgi:hypothetical protein
MQEPRHNAEAEKQCRRQRNNAGGKEPMQEAKEQQ